MLLFRQKPDLDPGLFALFGAHPDRTLFFDIETTGFSADANCIYLICAGCLDDGVPTIMQWFAETPQEENVIIENFLTFALEADCLVSFNGETFDVPFVEKKAEKYGIKSGLRYLRHIDLMKYVRACRDDLGLAHCRQKNVEALLNIERDDKYSGGELIEVYKQYVGRSRYDKLAFGTPLAPVPGSGLPTMPRTPSEALLTLLLLHNAEDVEGLIRISALFPLLKLLKGEELPAGEFAMEVSETKAGFIFKAECPMSADLELNIERGRAISLYVNSRTIEISYPIYKGSLKHYFDDYKNYYYLPAEDMAVYKSAGAGVQPEFRRNATRETCYIKKEAVFLPLKIEGLPEFKTDFKDSLVYSDVSSISSDTPGLSRAILGSFLRQSHR